MSGNKWRKVRWNLHVITKNGDVISCDAIKKHWFFFFIVRLQSCPFCSELISHLRLTQPSQKCERGKHQTDVMFRQWVGFVLFKTSILGESLSGKMAWEALAVNRAMELTGLNLLFSGIDSISFLSTGLISRAPFPLQRRVKSPE